MSAVEAVASCWRKTRAVRLPAVVIQKLLDSPRKINAFCVSLSHFKYNNFVVLLAEHINGNLVKKVILLWQRPLQQGRQQVVLSRGSKAKTPFCVV